jgi:aminoglycoside 6'-N-acetyltransferase
MTQSAGRARTTELHGRRVTLRPLAHADADELVAILAEPEVARWWPTFDRARVLGELIAEREAEEGFAIELDGRVVGYIQAAEEVDPEFRHASIDLFLATASQGQGLGPDAIRTLAADLIDRRGHHRITIDPVEDNTRAIAAYAKVGFRLVGRLRRYQLMGDGTWADALLMEMLAGELVRSGPGGTA